MTKLQSIDLRLTQDMLNDFDLLANHLLELTQKQFGFVSPMLFMHDASHNQLVLAHGETMLKFPLLNANHLLAQSFREQQLFTTHSYREIFEQPSDEQVSHEEKPLYILLPISVLDTPIGVFVVATKDQPSLSHLEQLFLQNFVEQISLQLMTTWALKHSLQINEQLAEANKDYLQLIEVKRSFLDQVQDLLLQYKDEEVSEERKQELYAALAYLQSVLLLSDTTIEKNKQKQAYETSANPSIGQLR